MNENQQTTVLTENDAKELGKRIFDTYDTNHSGKLEDAEIANMMIEIYKSLNKTFTPTQHDIAGFKSILDKNRDGHVTYGDVETTVFDFLQGKGPAV